MISSSITYQISGPLINVVRDAEILGGLVITFKKFIANIFEERGSLVSAENLPVCKPWVCLFCFVLFLTNKKYF